MKMALHVRTAFSQLKPGSKEFRDACVALRDRIEQIFIMVGRVRTPDISYALALGLHELGCEKPLRALSHFEYAQRSAPSDGAIMFAIGALRLVLDEPRSVEPLELLARQTGAREAIMELVSAYRHFGNNERAASSLGEFLACNAPGADVEFNALACALVDEIGAPGWCGLNNAGRLTIGGAARFLKEKLTVLLDGRLIRLHEEHRQTTRDTLIFKLRTSLGAWCLIRGLGQRAAVDWESDFRCTTNACRRSHPRRGRRHHRLVLVTRRTAKGSCGYSVQYCVFPTAMCANGPLPSPRSRDVSGFLCSA